MASGGLFSAAGLERISHALRTRPRFVIPPTSKHIIRQTLQQITPELHTSPSSAASPPPAVSVALEAVEAAAARPPRCAAVLLPLCLDAQVPSVLFIRRSLRLRNHRGQIAFPGGMFDPEDRADAVACALREADEEIGLARDDVRVLGLHHDCFTSDASTRVGTIITPVIGFIHRDVSVRGSQREREHASPLPLPCPLRSSQVHSGADCH